METRAVSGSWIELLARYVETRLPARLFVPCAGFLVVAALAGGGPHGAKHLALTGGLALLLLLHFRLWDDLADLPQDRLTHPDRVLVGAPSLAPFRALLAALFLVNLTLIALQPGLWRLVLFLLLNAAAFLWYWRLRSLLSGRVLAYHVVVAKYPAFVLLLSARVEHPWRLALGMALVYLSFTIYEVLHHPALRGLAEARRALALEIVAFFFVAELMALDLLGRGALAVAVQGLLGLLALLLLGGPLGRRLLAASEKASYIVFALGIALVLNYSIGDLP